MEEKNSKITIGQKAADKITKILGSWEFILIQSFILAIWIILNFSAWINHWDPYPFILLNLVLSFQAAYTAPIILMSENREADRERRKTALDLSTDKKAEKEILEIKQMIENLEKNKFEKILRLLDEKKDKINRKKSG